MGKVPPFIQANKPPFMSEPVAMADFIEEQIAEGNPEMVFLAYDIEKEFVENIWGDDAHMVMTKKWHEAFNENLKEDMDAAMANSPLEVAAPLETGEKKKPGSKRVD